jgi:5-bromo-4-chloroindolyl phosphate hydrolysis protein
MMTLLKGILSGSIGAIVFITFLFVINIGFLVSAIAGFVSFGATLLIFNSLSQSNTTIEVQSASDQFYRNALKEGYQKVDEIRLEVQKINDLKMKEQGEELIEICDKIFRKLEEDPKDMKAVRQFFTYYLDALLNILQKSNQISNNGLKGDEVARIHAQINQHLDSLKKIFEDKLNKLLEDDFMDLDIELQMLNKMMKAEGIEQ